VIAVVCGLGAFYTLLGVLLVRRERRRPLERDRIVREAREDAAAREVDALELLYDLPAYDPAWEAGLERLWNAARDEQNGDPT
jgi:hypothetical protein